MLTFRESARAAGHVTAGKQGSRETSSTRKDGTLSLKRSQVAAARQLSLVAFLLSSDGRARDEGDIRSNLPPYLDTYEASLAGIEANRELAADALRKQLERDVEALAGAGLRVEVEGHARGRRYRMPRESFSPLELDLSDEEQAVFVGAIRALRRDFPYSGPVRLALANLVGAASDASHDGEPTFAAVASRDDEEVARQISVMEGAVARRKRIRFDYYSINRDETSSREVEPYAISRLEGLWYVTGLDTGRTAVRQFRLSRVRGRVTFATKHSAGDFTVPDDFDHALAEPRAPWQLGNTVGGATVRVVGGRNSLDGELAADFEAAGSFDPDGEDEIFTTEYSGERQLASRLLNAGAGVRALSPDSLVRRIVEGLERIESSHSGGAS